MFRRRDKALYELARRAGKEAQEARRFHREHDMFHWQPHMDSPEYRATRHVGFADLIGDPAVKVEFKKPRRF